MKSNKVLMLAVALLTAVLLPSCAASPTPPPAAAPTATAASAQPSAVSVQPTAATVPPTVAPAQVRQDLVVGLEGLGSTVDGFFTSAQSWIHSNLIFDPLFRVDEHGNPKPALAVSWKTVEPTIWEIKLREGVKFHDGEEFDAEDVKFSFDHWLNPNSKYPNLYRINFVTNVQVVDKFTVRLTTKAPSPLLPNFYNTVYLWPKDYFSKVGVEGFQKAPIGTGPFRFVEWRRDDYLSLAANKDYWGGSPKLSTLKLLVKPEAASRVAALEAGEIQLVQSTPVEQMERLRAAGFQTQAVPIGQSFVLMFKLAGASVAPQLQDKRVRQAIAYAIDIDAITKNLTLGTGRKLEGQLVGPDGFGYNPNIKAYPFDPAKAKALLADAGYPNGFTVKYMFGEPRYFKGKEVAQTVAGYLGNVGIKVELEVLEWSVWAQKYLGGESGPMTHQGANYLPGMDVSNEAILLTSSAGPKLWGNTKFDDLFDRYQTTLDKEQRLKTAYEIAELFHEEVPWVPLFQIPALFSMSPKLKGVVFGSDGLIYFDGAYLQ